MYVVNGLVHKSSFLHRKGVLLNSYGLILSIGFIFSSKLLSGSLQGKIRECFLVEDCKLTFMWEAMTLAASNYPTNWQWKCKKPGLGMFMRWYKKQHLHGK